MFLYMSVKQVSAASSVFRKTACLHLATFMLLTRFKAVEARTKEYEFGKKFAKKEDELFFIQQQNSVSEFLIESEYHQSCWLPLPFPCVYKHNVLHVG